MSVHPSAPAGAIRDASLEAIRGIACLSVLAWHVSLAFFPWLSGIFEGFDPAKAINGRFWFAPMNGTAAVGVFFVLSGFVLTRRAIVQNDTHAILRGAAKRWPRLVGPVLIAVLLSYSLFALGGYRFGEAGAVTHSPWLQRLGYGLPKQGFTPHFIDALAQGSILTFVRGDSTYDSSLWTMRVEFLGSFFAFALALALIAAGPRRRTFGPLLLILGASAAAWAGPWYFDIIAGVALAGVLPERIPRIPLWLAGPLGLSAIYLLGYTDGRGDYAWLAGWVGRGANAPYVYAVAAVIIIVLAESDGSLRRRLSQPWARALGRLSFPMYLLHLIVICSLGSAVFLATQGVLADPWPSIAAALTTVAGTLGLAIPLAIADVWWTQWLTRQVRQVFTAIGWSGAPQTAGAAARRSAAE